MWKFEQIKKPNRLLDHVHLSNGRISAKIYPNLGGSLQSLKLDQVEVINGIQPDEKGLQDYRNAFMSSILFPFPNRVKDGIYTYGGSSYKLNVNDLAFNNAIHGLVHDKEFSQEVVEHTNDRISLKLVYSSDGSEDGFPFAYDLALSYTFIESGEVVLKFEVLNTGYQTFPFGIGWHPYFRSSHLGTSRISSKFKDHFLCPERMIPEEKEKAEMDEQFAIGELSFDDGYTLHEPYCALETHDYRLALDFDTGSEPFLQIYTPEHRNSIALEPMTCVTNALNNGIGLEALDPGQTREWSINIKIQVIEN